MIRIQGVRLGCRPLSSISRGSLASDNCAVVYKVLEGRDEVGTPEGSPHIRAQRHHSIGATHDAGFFNRLRKLVAHGFKHKVDNLWTTKSLADANF